MVLPDSRRIPRARRYLGSYSASALGFGYRALTLSGGPSQTLPLPFAFFLASVPADTNSYPPLPIPCSDCSLLSHRMFGLFPVRSPLLGKSLLISSPRSTEMFQFPRFPRIHYRFIYACRKFPCGGFPHSGTSGSSPACRSPEHFAACRALLQLLAPRHPPYALSFLTSFHCAIFKVQSPGP